MSFADLMKKQQQKLSQGNFSDEEVVYPTSVLKNKQLIMNKSQEETDSVIKSPDYLVRILPSVTGDIEGFAEGTRNLFIEATNSGGKQLQLNVVLPEDADRENEYDLQINDWIANGNIPNRYGSKPQKRYLLNAVRLFKDNNGQIVHELDDNGDLVVRLLTIPMQAYEGLVGKMGDTMLYPQGVSDDDPAFISSRNAFPVRINRTGEKLNTKYNVEVYSNIPLGELPQGWEQQAENLKYQATPTYEFNKNFLDYTIAVANGQEEEFNNSRSGEENGQGQQPYQPQGVNNSADPFGQPSSPQTNNQFEQEASGKIDSMFDSFEEDNQTPQQPQQPQQSVNNQPQQQNTQNQQDTEQKSSGVGQNIDDFLADFKP